MRYLVPFGPIEDWLDKHESCQSGVVGISYDQFLDVIRLILPGLSVDRDWYLQRSPGLDQAIAAGAFRSVSHHYVMHGYFEGREPRPPSSELPSPFGFAAMRRLITVKSVHGQLQLNMEKSQFVAVIQRLLVSVEIDADWYLRQNPGVDEAIKKGQIASAMAHYVAHGYFESRLPFDMDVDERWYRERYPDLSDAFEQGHFVSARDHFIRKGYGQGRVPAAIWER